MRSSLGGPMSFSLRLHSFVEHMVTFLADNNNINDSAGAANTYMN